MPLISVDIKFHNYGPLKALGACKLTIKPGALVAIVGPNGGGKSTFLKILAGLFPPTEGTINLGSITRDQIAYLAQAKELDRTFPIRVEDVVAMGLWSEAGIFQSFKKAQQDKIIEALKSVGLSGYDKRPISALSGGELQRLLFARLIAQDASLILLDEPFTGVDKPTVKHLIKLILDWHAQGKTVLAVLHEVSAVKEYFPQTMLISKELITEGKTKDVFTIENLARAAFNV